MKTLILICILLLSAGSGERVTSLPTDYESIVEECAHYEHTVVFLWAPFCRPCVGELKKLKSIKADKNQRLVLLTLIDQKVEILTKLGFDTSYYFNPDIYKTHTLDYDEFNQFTDEILKDVRVNNKNRVVFPAIFIIDKQKQLKYFSNDETGRIDTATIHALLKSKVG